MRRGVVLNALERAVSEQQIPTNWWNDFFESDLWAQVHLMKTRDREQTIKELEFIKKVAPKKADSLSILDMPCGVGPHQSPHFR